MGPCEKARALYESLTQKQGRTRAYSASALILDSQPQNCRRTPAVWAPGGAEQDGRRGVDLTV